MNAAGKIQITGQLVSQGYVPYRRAFFPQPFSRQQLLRGITHGKLPNHGKIAYAFPGKVHHGRLYLAPFHTGYFPSPVIDTAGQNAGVRRQQGGNIHPRPGYNQHANPLSLLFSDDICYQSCAERDPFHRFCFRLCQHPVQGRKNAG